MSFVKLASLPAARSAQVAAAAHTLRFNVDTNELMIDTSSDVRAYILLENLSANNLRYYYTSGDFAEGMTIMPKCGVRIINRETVYVALEAGTGEICMDRGEG